MSYNPNGISFSKLEANTKKGNVYYVIKYWTDLVMDGTQQRRIEYLDRGQAQKVYDKLKALDRAYYFKMGTFCGDTWEEHAQNFWSDNETYIEG